MSVSDHLYRACFKTEMGPLGVCWSDRGLVSIDFGMKGKPDSNLPAPFTRFLASLERYFSGRKTAFQVPLILDGVPPYLKKVLIECAQIPYGETRSYGELAALTGNPRGARAVGQAMARNPIPVVIPCHRVLPTGKGLGGFGGGLDWKRYLLKLEGITWKE
ncbi:MAG: methylated-DNA--[protein]-cysteine S-methyltransferase [Candidatus Omnitrophica bacterium]|nr:methylated-DNA--[protein]-cysteine S-methyltransferase [Candidatus Omnitrophota bacterium]